MLFRTIGTQIGCKKYPTPSKPAKGVKFRLNKYICLIFLSTACYLSKSTAGVSFEGIVTMSKVVFLKDRIPIEMMKTEMIKIVIAPYDAIFMKILRSLRKQIIVKKKYKTIEI